MARRNRFVVKCMILLNISTNDRLTGPAGGGKLGRMYYVCTSVDDAKKPGKGPFMQVMSPLRHNPPLPAYRRLSAHRTEQGALRRYNQIWERRNEPDRVVDVGREMAIIHSTPGRSVLALFAGPSDGPSRIARVIYRDFRDVDDVPASRRRAKPKELVKRKAAAKARRAPRKV